MKHELSYFLLLCLESPPARGRGLKLSLDGGIGFCRSRPLRGGVD